MSSHISIIETTSIKCILLNKKLPNELVSIIIEFSFQDLYKAKKIHQDNFINVRNQIDSCETKFRYSDNEESWYIRVTNTDPRLHPLELRAINCKKCGQYKFSQTDTFFYKSIGCFCPDNIDYMRLLASDYGSDWTD